MMRRLRARLWIEAITSGTAAMLAIITLLWRDWIEVLLRVDPDAHSGRLEWLMVAALVAAAVACGSVARRDWRVSMA